MLSVSAIGFAHAMLWLVALLLCEAWTWISTRPAMHRELTRGEMIGYIFSGAATMPAWAALGVFFWYTPDTNSNSEHPLVAMALWVGQLLYTQRFIFQSYLAVVMGNIVMVGTMVVVPLVHPVLTGSELILFEIGLLFCVGFTISTSLASYSRVRSMAEQNAVIERAAVTDSLTGLPNRRGATKALHALAIAQTPVCILYMDLDRFKQVNDTLGHQAGDALLRQFAARLLKVSQPGTLVARLGGDEFAVMLEGESASIENADALCTRILETVQEPFRIANGVAHVGVSIGVANAEEGQGDGEDLVRRADIALYTVKAAGRNGFKVFNYDFEMQVRDRANIEQALRDTLDAGTGFELIYQPKVDHLGALTGVEALLRWKMENRPISPDIFVPIAEETGLMRPIGTWVLREAFAFARRWPELSVAVNLSPAQLHDASFVERVIAMTEEFAVLPARIELEVTETTLFDIEGQGTSRLKELRAAGLQVSLDDFGTGYSSLRHLHRVSVDRVKIDRAFVAGLETDTESGAIIEAVIQLAHSMGIQVTAEGVETAFQRDYLIRVGADELQGFYFSHPMSEQALMNFQGGSSRYPMLSSGAGGL